MSVALYETLAQANAEIYSWQLSITVCAWMHYRLPLAHPQMHMTDMYTLCKSTQFPFVDIICCVTDVLTVQGS